MVEFILTVAPSGAGKTTWAHQHDDTHLVVDSDEQRKRLFNDESFQGNNARVFNEMLTITRNALRAGQSVIYAATNLVSKRRINLLKELRREFPNVKYKCVVFNTPIEICRERNSKRSRVVPLFVLDKQVKQFQMPFYNEGWDEIEIIKTANYDVKALAEKVWEDARAAGSQDNPHHTLTLYEHLQKTIECVDLSKCKNDIEQAHMLMAAALHDIGKAYTRVYDDNGIAHFYSHENLSGYLSMNMGAPIEVIWLVNYHMYPYNPQAIPAWKNRLGEELWEKIMILHNADEAAH